MEHPLRNFRKENGISLDKLARQVEVSSASLSRIESRKQFPSRELAARLSSATGIDARELLGIPFEEPAA